MPTHLVIPALTCVALLSAATSLPAQVTTAEPPSRDLLAELKPMPNDLARYRHLLATPSSGNDDVTRQLQAALDDQLGLYNRALLEFPV